MLCGRWKGEGRGFAKGGGGREMLRTRSCILAEDVLLMFSMNDSTKWVKLSITATPISLSFSYYGVTESASIYKPKPEIGRRVGW